MVKKQKKSKKQSTRTIIKIVQAPPVSPDLLGGMGNVVGAGVGLMSLGVIGSMGVGITSQIGSMLHAHKKRSRFVSDKDREYIPYKLEPLVCEECKRKFDHMEEFRMFDGKRYCLHHGPGTTGRNKIWG